MGPKDKTGTAEWADTNRNLYLGCEHDCRECYAKTNALRFKQIKSLDDWKKMRFLQKEFFRPVKALRGKTIMFPSRHDIIPEHIDVVIDYLSKWLMVGNKFLIVSKPHFECVAAICDRLQGYRGQITFRFTIGSLDEDHLKFWNPNAPGIEERLQSLRYAYDSGYKTSISCEPYYDDNIRGLIEVVMPYVTDTIWIGKMNKIKERVDTSNFSPNDFKFLEEIEGCQCDQFIKDLYEDLRVNSKIRWKDSCRGVLRIPPQDGVE